MKGMLLKAECYPYSVHNSVINSEACALIASYQYTEITDTYLLM